MKLGSHTCLIETEFNDVFLVLDGKRIARRGTLLANQWIPIEPGYTVSGSLEEIEIRFNGELIR